MSVSKSIRRKPIYQLAWLLPLLLTLAPRVQAGPEVVVGRDVPSTQRISMSELDHQVWTELLAKYVDSRGMVDYTTWKASSSDQAKLDKYIDQLAGVRVSTANQRSVQLAFWINAYNAVTIKGILREYPTTSIRKHTARLWGYNIWKDLKLRVDGKKYSLEDIEHNILRKLGEPRIHFAIVCASIGCPRLLDEAYVPQEVDDQLTLNAKAFFGDRAKFRIDANAKRVYLSPILSWFGEDFGSSRSAQLRAIAPYVPNNATELVTSGKARVSFLDYDWGLNDQKTTR